MLKKVMIRVAVLLLVFAASIFGFGKILNRNMPDTTEEMKPATLPLVYMLNGEQQINRLHGYTREMDVTALRDALTPIDGQRTLQIQIQPYQNKIENISFEVLTSDGETSLENTKVTKIQEDGEYLNATLELQNKILMNTEYMLKIAITSINKEAYYYTRILQEDGLKIDSYVDFAMDFYENCLQGNDLNIEEFVEPDPGADTSTFSHLDIHSSLDQMIWKGLSPEIYDKPVANIRELNENTCTLLLDYMISATPEDGEQELYHVSEYYRMRYTDSRILLLDFERDTNQVFQPKDNILRENGICLGITDRNITYKNDLRNNFYAFVMEGALWFYDISGNKLAQVFSFPQETNSDDRDRYHQNDIQIINIDEQGNMYFLVCGYMNRGNHEGESGVAVYSYDAASSIVSECLFVDTKQAYPLLRKDMKTLAYVTDDRNGFYLLTDGEVYKVDMTTREVTSVVSGLEDGCYGASASGRQFAWVKENDRYDSRIIEVMDLETQTVREITCSEEERLQIMGFIEEDLVYGIAAEGKIDASHKGNEIFPMNRLEIVNSAGDVVKEYKPEDSFVSGAKIENKLMTIFRIRKEGKNYKEVQEDQIVNSAVGEETDYGIAGSSNGRQREVKILRVGTTLNTEKVPKIVRARQLIYEGSKAIALEPKAKKSDVYYVYAKGELDSIYSTANLAIQRADEALGVVVNSKQQMVWERGNKKTKLDLNVETFPQAFLEYSMDFEQIQSKMKETLLDLRGCTLEEVLYFVSHGTPVLAKTPEGVVLIGGYDEYNTRLLKPGESELSYYGIQDSTALFEEAGNVFIGYLDPLTE